MRVYQRILNNLGLDGFIVLFLAVFALGLSVFDWISNAGISTPALVGILSLLLIEAILRRYKLEAMEEKIIKSLNGVRAELLSDGKEFQKKKYQLILQAERSIYDMELCQPPISQKTDEGYFEARPQRQLLYERIKQGDILYRFVQVISDKNQFERQMRRLLQFYTCDFYIGYFFSPPETIPVLNLMIFDEKKFLMGGYYGISQRGNDRNLYLENETVGETLNNYFDYSWREAHLLNQKNTIIWDEVKACGLHLGYTEEELKARLQEIADEVGSGVKIPF